MNNNTEITRFVAILIGAVVLIAFSSFMIGYCYKESQVVKDQMKIVENTAQTLFADTCYKFLKDKDGFAWKLDIPEEITEVSSYDEPELDLLYAFRDDGGDIHIRLTKWRASRASLGIIDPPQDDPEEQILNHSKIPNTPNKPKLPTENN
jgi:hypothetical protein